jgi:hypothetical protein
VGRRLVAVLLAAGVLVGCSSGDDDADDTVGIEDVYDKAGEVAEGSSPEQAAACAVSERQITTAVTAWRASTGDTAGQPTYEELVAEGFLEVSADQPWTITYGADGTPTAAPSPGAACEVVAGS